MENTLPGSSQLQPIPESVQAQPTVSVTAPTLAETPVNNINNTAGKNAVSRANNSQLLLWVIVGLVVLLPVVGVGGYYFGKQQAGLNNVELPAPDVINPIPDSSGLTPSPVSESEPAVEPEPQMDGDNPVACTMEAKICPDGSAVGRSGPNCEFEACPN